MTWIGSVYKAVILLLIILWLKYYFVRLPKDIRDLKKKRELYRTRNDPTVLSQFKSDELRVLYIRDCLEEYQVTVFNFILFWFINLLLIFVIYFELVQPLLALL